MISCLARVAATCAYETCACVFVCTCWCVCVCVFTATPLSGTAGRRTLWTPRAHRCHASLASTHALVMSLLRALPVMLLALRVVVLAAAPPEISRPHACAPRSQRRWGPLLNGACCVRVCVFAIHLFNRVYACVCVRARTSVSTSLPVPTSLSGCARIYPGVARVTRRAVVTGFCHKRINAR